MKKFIALLLLLTMVFMVACGPTEDSGSNQTGGTSKDPGNDNTQQETEKAAQGVYDDKILVGNTAATSGALAVVGAPFVAGIEAYFKYINDQGGVNGRKIVFVHKDDEFDPAKGKAMLSELIDDDKIFALVGHFGTPVVGATIEDIKEKGIPAVYFATGIGQMYFDKAEGNERCIFPVQPIYKTEGQIMVTRAYKDFDAKNKIGVIYTSDDAGKDLLEGAKKKAEELGIAVAEEQVSVGAADVSSAVSKIKNENVDFIIIAAIQQTFPTIAKELAAQGVNKDCITTYVNVSPDISQLVGADIKGKFDVYGLGWVDLGGDHADAVKLFADNTPDFKDNVFAMTGWIAGHFFVEGLKRVEGTVTWEKFIDAMESAPIANPFGGKIDYANGVRMGTQAMNLSKVGDDGNWVAVDGLKSMDELLGK